MGGGDIGNMLEAEVLQQVKTTGGRTYRWVADPANAPENTPGECFRTVII